MLSVRDGARLVAETFVTEPNTSMAGRTGMRILMDAGLPAEQAAWTMFAVGHYVLGHTIEEQSTGADREAKLAAQAEADADLRELAAAIGADPGRRFEFGLALMIDGIRVRVSGRTPADS
ncbi:TetR/AcrR family transcriptional regulator C-terminal domain-containing protein [Paractinoplanes durhamensis]|uniref:TetR/AcrR family transcriptional regulator C-terminal domain-containing protein n=1 Tax=Paractinoplanes durhamensis TaxID=113563 RepID=UPI00363374E8